MSAWEVYELGRFVETVEAESEREAIEKIEAVEPGDCVAVQVETAFGQTFREWLRSSGRTREPSFYEAFRRSWRAGNEPPQAPRIRFGKI